MKKFKIYHIPHQKKVGATQNVKDRVENQQGISPNKYSILHSTNSLLEASKLEQQEQSKRGYVVDSRPYHKTIAEGKKSQIKITDRTIGFTPEKEDFIEWGNDYLEIDLDDKTYIIEGEEKVLLLRKNLRKTHQPATYKYRSYIYIDKFRQLFNDTTDPTIFDNVRQWHKDRKITVNGNIQIQALKIMEEAGELADAILKQQPDKIKDAVGDLLVVLSSISDFNGHTLEEAYEFAWDEIKDRTDGYLAPNGDWIREGKQYGKEH